MIRCRVCLPLLGFVSFIHALNHKRDRSVAFLLPSNLFLVYSVIDETDRSLLSEEPRMKRDINPWFIAVTVTLATFMELLDTAVANVSLPHIAGGMATSHDESTWVLTSYLIANAVVLPLSAWLSRVFGRKNYYM